VKGLTKPRREFLEGLVAAGGVGPGAAHYPPIKWLQEHGLIEKREGRFSTYWTITDAGLAALPPADRQVTKDIEASQS
jgi:DNA-binding PadR family transcriptional regulator